MQQQQQQQQLRLLKIRRAVCKLFCTATQTRLCIAPYPNSASKHIHKQRISILNHVTMYCCRNTHPYINNTFPFLCIRPSMAGRILLAIWWRKLKLHITDLYHRRENALPIYKCTFPEQHIVRWSTIDISCSYIYVHLHQ